MTGLGHPVDTEWDPRTALAGNVIGRRFHHEGILRVARQRLDDARWASHMGDRAAAARALTAAGRSRRLFYERTTPAPPPPNRPGRWVWIRSFHDWLDLS